jgi:hypothetical protein
VNAGAQSNPWDVFLFAAAVCRKSPAKLADEILDSTPELLSHLLAPPTGSGFSHIQPAARFCGWIIDNRPFPGGRRCNTVIGYSYLRHLIEEAECPWPCGSLQVEIAKAVQALEVGTIDENWFVDSVCGAVAEEVRRLRGQLGDAATA